MVRLLFQLELAHWFYIDYYTPDANKKDEEGETSVAAATTSKCRNVGYREFARQMFAHVPFLQPLQGQLDSAIAEWRTYKSAVPTCGAVLITPDLEKVLLVQGYWAKASWGFPKGKINQDESPHECAAREVLEETGFDIIPLMKQKHFIESVINDTTTRLFVIPGVPEDTAFEPRTRNEIRRCSWFVLHDLPQHKNDQSKQALGLYANHFFTVMPFVSKIQKWVDGRKHKLGIPIAPRATATPTNSAFSRVSPSRHPNKSGTNTPKSSKQKEPKVKHFKPRTLPPQELQYGVLQPASAWTTDFAIDWQKVQRCMDGVAVSS